MSQIFTIVLFSFMLFVGGKAEVALLIGNSDYSSYPHLPNPVNDVELVSLRLTEGGYKTSVVKDANLESMVSSIEAFCEKAKDSKKAVIFYAGHGIEIDGENYLLPIDAEIINEGDEKIQAVALTSILEQVEKAAIGIKIVVLDCCRDNPFLHAGLSGKGMAAVEGSDLSPGTMVVYSGKPGLTVPDGPEEGNSPFTEALNKQFIRSEGRSCMDVFSDLGDFLGEINKHWVKIDNDGSTLALLTRTPFFKSDKEAKQKEEKKHIPEGFVHHSRVFEIALYKGVYESDEAYFAVGYHNEKEFSGYLFFQEGASVRYFTGSLGDSDEMEMMVWKNGKEDRFARMRRNEEKNVWEGQTNLGEISFSREVKEIQNYKHKGEYSGVLGFDEVEVMLRWNDEISLEGEVIKAGETLYKMIGDNSLDGTIFANLYGELGHEGVVLLKKSVFNGVSWTGVAHFNSAKKKLLSVKKK